MKEPVWISKSFVLAIHERSLADHGGAAGIRDLGLLESALARAVNRLAYNKKGTLFDLAAAYAFGIVKNHPFIDGNKRAAFIAAVTFLDVNGVELEADEVGATIEMLALAAGKRTEAEFSEWLRENSGTR